MSKRFKTKRLIHFGDCDPAQIVYYPRYFEMFDRNSEGMFRDRGVFWEEMHVHTNFAGMPIIDIKANFKVAVKMGDEIEIQTWIDEFRAKTFLIRHELYRGDVLCADCHELRAYIITDESRPQGIAAAAMPEEMRRKLAG